MKTIENITIYKCDFCNKELKRKYAMINHELKCNRNPQNFRPCYYCEHLESKNDGSIEIHYVAGGNFETRHEPQPNYFFCNKKQIRIYSPQAEFKGLLETYPETFEEQEPMPKKCDVFQEISLI